MTSTLVVTVIHARLTHDTETFGKMDPYCKLHLGKQNHQTRVHESAGKFPMWDETFTFRRTTEDLLVIEVWDKDTLKDDLVGIAEVQVARIGGAKTAEDLDLKYNARSAGTIRVSMQLANSAQQVPSNPVPGYYPAVPQCAGAPGYPTAYPRASQYPSPMQANASAPQAYPYPYQQPAGYPVTNPPGAGPNAPHY